MGNKASHPSQKKKVYRIPALLYLKASGTLLAFAERRKSKADASAEKLEMRVGTQQEESTKLTITWSSKMEVKEASLPGHRTMNPCPVYEETSKTIFLFFVCVKNGYTEWWQLFTGCNKARLCYITSKDNGKSWSQVTDLTDELQKVMKNWTTFAVGPGHGIQTKSGKLIIPTYAYCPAVPFYRSVPYSVAVCSDDSGKTWHIDTKLTECSLECEMAEVFDDTGKSYVYCNARTRNAQSFRVEAHSEDEGSTFTIPPSGEKLVETGTGCQGSVIGFPAPSESEIMGDAPIPNLNTWLLYTHPADWSNRRNLGVYVNCSPLNPTAWSQPWIINRGPSGYSDLAYLGDGRFACLMERGEKTAIEQIASVVFTYNDIKQEINIETTSVFS